jgi:hypothetical protein
MSRYKSFEAFLIGAASCLVASACASAFWGVITLVSCTPAQQQNVNSELTAAQHAIAKICEKLSPSDKADPAILDICHAAEINLESSGGSQ